MIFLVPYDKLDERTQEIYAAFSPANADSDLIRFHRIKEILAGVSVDNQEIGYDTATEDARKNMLYLVEKAKEEKEQSK